jgi:hypothetical protein
MEVAEDLFNGMDSQLQKLDMDNGEKFGLL